MEGRLVFEKDRVSVVDREDGLRGTDGCDSFFSFGCEGVNELGRNRSTGCTG